MNRNRSLTYTYSVLKPVPVIAHLVEMRKILCLQGVWHSSRIYFIKTNSKKIDTQYLITSENAVLHNPS